MRAPLLLILTMTPLVAVPSTTEMTLVEENGFNEFLLTVVPSILPADSDTTVLSSPVDAFDQPVAPITATLDVDPLTGTTSQLSFTGGRIEGTDTVFSGSSLFIGNYLLDFTNLAGTVTTPAPPAPVDPLTGNFDASLHLFTIDQGNVDGSVKPPGSSSIPVAIVFTPAESVSGPGQGTGTVTLSETGSNALSTTYDITVVLPVDISQTTVTNGQSVTVKAVGILKFAGTTVVPVSAYIGWTMDNNIVGASADDDINGDGVPNGIAWALGYDAITDASPSLPRPLPENPGVFEILLPAAGTAAPLTLQTSTNLSGWLPVDTLRLSSGANPIPAASTGVITVSALGGTEEFLRMQSPE